MTQGVRTVGSRGAAVLGLAWGICGLLGCASLGTAEAPGEAPKRRAIAAYAADPFEPVNLYLNANEHVGPRHARMLEYVAQQLRDSGAFVRVDRGVSRWQSTLQMRYWWDEPSTVGDRAARTLNAVTLGLARVKVTQTHHLRVEVIQEPEPVGSLEYVETLANPVSFSESSALNDQERAVMDRLLEKMMADLARKKMIPRLREFEGPPEEKKKRKEHRV